MMPMPRHRIPILIAAPFPSRSPRYRPEPKRVVILEFADKGAIKRWYNSPEYQKILPRRIDNATGRAFIVEGVS